jgi:hypothetical protein
MPQPKKTRGPGRPAEGRVKVMVSMDPEQVDALRREAFRAAAEDRRARPDVSALVREAVDAWLKRGK